MNAKKKKEEHMAKFLTSINLDFKREHRIDFKCVNSNTTWCNIDFIIIFNACLFFIECDEDQHRQYDVICENDRMNKCINSLFIEGNRLPIVFIRFNPDTYRINNIIQKIKIQDRYNQLYKFMIEFKPNKPVSVKYLFYNEIDNKLEILKDPLYDKEFKKYLV